MRAIDTSNWKNVRVGDIFDRIIKPDVIHSKAVRESDGGIPYVVRSKFNNGIKCYVEREDFFRPSPAGTISFGAENATFFYQPSEYISGRDIYYIDTTNLSKYACLFIVSCLRKIADKYSYNYGLFPDLLKEEHIMIPVNDDQSPNWSYMESYMKDIRKQMSFRMNNLQVETPSTNIDINGWKLYKIGNLMHRLDLKILKPNFDKRIDTSLEKTDEFNLPLVNAKDGNNGIMYYGRNEDFESESMCIDIVQNGAVATGNVYAQIEKTGVLWDAYLVKTWDNISENSLLYLAMVMQKMIKQKYCYSDKAIWEKVSLDEIYLPKGDDLHPDWAYMDKYMRNIKKSIGRRIQSLRRDARVHTEPTPRVN